MYIYIYIYIYIYKTYIYVCVGGCRASPPRPAPRPLVSAISFLINHDVIIIDSDLHT